MYYVYIDHLYDIPYISDTLITDDVLYCDKCGDMDRLVKAFETEDEAREYIDDFYTPNYLLDIDDDIDW